MIVTDTMQTLDIPQAAVDAVPYLSIHLAY
jgi:hypothetical protein